jgi:cytochrome c-type biogenesis protein CcmH/NrfG
VSDFFKASDIHPEDAQPYLFLGRLHQSDISQSAGFLDRMARFARLQPQNPWANYYYAASLWTQRKDLNDSTAVVSLLENAIQLDPQMAVAFLELGIVHADEQDFPAAIRSYQRAIEIDPTLEQAHYRLAQAYRQSNQPERAQAENAVFQKLSKTSSEELARERAELQRFVVTLKQSAPAH